jgi:hypothetical protein
MDEKITKAELAAYTESNNKLTAALEKISGTLHEFSDLASKINTKLYEMPKEIVDIVTERCQNCSDDSAKDNLDIREKLKEIKTDTATTRIDSNNLKLFVGLISVAIIIVTSVVNIVARGIDSKNLYRNTVESTQEIASNIKIDIKKELQEEIKKILSEIEITHPIKGK